MKILILSISLISVLSFMSCSNIKPNVDGVQITTEFTNAEYTTIATTETTQPSNTLEKNPDNTHKYNYKIDQYSTPGYPTKKPTPIESYKSSIGVMDIYLDYENENFVITNSEELNEVMNNIPKEHLLSNSTYPKTLFEMLEDYDDNYFSEHFLVFFCIRGMGTKTQFDENFIICGNDDFLEITYLYRNQNITEKETLYAPFFLLELPKTALPKNSNKIIVHSAAYKFFWYDGHIYKFLSINDVESNKLKEMSKTEELKEYLEYMMSVTVRPFYDLSIHNIFIKLLNEYYQTDYTVYETNINDTQSDINSFTPGYLDEIKYHFCLTDYGSQDGIFLSSKIEIENFINNTKIDVSFEDSYYKNTLLDILQYYDEEFFVDKDIVLIFTSYSINKRITELVDIYISNKNRLNASYIGGVISDTDSDLYCCPCIVLEVPKKSANNQTTYDAYDVSCQRYYSQEKEDDFYISSLFSDYAENKSLILELSSDKRFLDVVKVYREKMSYAADNDYWILLLKNIDIFLNEIQ